MDHLKSNEQAADRDHRPLADRIRPQTLDEFFGQGHLLKEGSLLRRAIEEDRLFSVIFLSPPNYSASLSPDGGTFPIQADLG